MKIPGNKEPVSRVHEVKGHHSISKKSGVRHESHSPVEISNLASELAELQGDLNNLPDIRYEKVNKIKGDIEQGKYTIDDGKLAEALAPYFK